MFLLIFQQILSTWNGGLNLNTSHVLINPGNRYRPIKRTLHLNTSHVLINQRKTLNSPTPRMYLNTSHVLINQKRIKKAVCAVAFKYISCSY